MANDHTPQPTIDGDGVPYCVATCPYYVWYRINECFIDGKYVEVEEVCIPAVRAMAQRLRELEDRA